MKLKLSSLRKIIQEEVSRAMDEAAARPRDAVGEGLALWIGKRKWGRQETLYVLYDPSAILEDLERLRVKGQLDVGVVPYEVFADATRAVVATMPPPQDAPQWGASTVSFSAAEGNYGPMLYDIAMAHGGLVSDRDSVSIRARKVWRYYADNRSDVEARPLDDFMNPKTPSKKDDGIMHPGGARSPLNYAYFIRRSPATARLEANHKSAWSAIKAYLPRKASAPNEYLEAAATRFFDDHYNS